MEKKLDLILQKVENIEVMVNEHSEILKSHSEILNYLSDILNGHGKKLDSHSEILNSHSKKLDSHSEILSRYSEKLDQLNARVDGNSKDIKSIKSKMLTKIDIQYFDQKITEHDREIMKIKLR